MSMRKRRIRRGENPRRQAALRGNKDRERALARRVEVWRRDSTGELYLVDVNTMRCVGAVAGDQIRSGLTQARSSRVDEFLDLHWAFDAMAPQPLPGRAHEWTPVAEDELP
jgi:hypothetical protein